MSERVWQVVGEAAMEALGARLGPVLAQGALVFLNGNLGAGKTTLSRGLLRGLGHSGPVKSPTYTLVETYSPAGHTVHHFDLYRLVDAEELEYMGIRDYLASDVLCLVEWPERGAGVLPAPDLCLEISGSGDSRTVQLRANTERGEQLIALIYNDENDFHS